MRFLSNPHALWFLLLLPVLALLGWWSSYRKSKMHARFGDLFSWHRSRAVNSGIRLARRICLVICLLLLILGAAGPRWGRDWKTQTMSGRDIVVVLDLSRSMLADPKPRQERAKTALLHLADTIKRRGGHRLALVVFAADAEVVCPLTNDYDHFRFMVEKQDANYLPRHIRPDSSADVSGTRIGKALRLAVQLHDAEFKGSQDILLVSDGDDPARDDEWLEGVIAAEQTDIPVDVVGVGDPDLPSRIPFAGGYLRFENEDVRSKLQEGPLKEIARRTGGAYIPMRTKQLPLGKVYHEVTANRGKTRDNDPSSLPVYIERYAWFLAAAFVFLMVTLLLGEGRSRRRSISS